MQLIWLSDYNVQNMVTSKAKNKTKQKKIVCFRLHGISKQGGTCRNFFLFIFFCLVQNFNMGMIGKQCVLLGKYNGIP